ncbi:hypothetical protein ACE6H2_021493 [Prunus campanulata]
MITRPILGPKGLLFANLVRKRHKANWRDNDKTRVQIFEHLAVQIKPTQYSSKYRIFRGIIANKFSCPKILLHRARGCAVKLPEISAGRSEVRGPLVPVPAST